MMKSKLKAMVLILAFVLAIAAGCGPRENVNPGGKYDVDLNPDTQASFTLRVAVDSSQVETKAMQNVAALLNQTYPNVNVSVEPMGSDVRSYILICMATNDMPDIFFLNQFDMVMLESMEVILNLNPYIESETAAGSFDENEFVQAYWELGQKDFSGDQLMIPRSMDRVVCHYNKKIFAAAGVDMSLVRNGWTWDDFETVCATLRAYFDANGMTGPLADSNYSWEAMVNPVFEAYGVEYFDDNGKIVINSTETENALKFFKKMYDNKYFSGPEGGGADFDGLKGAMAFDSQPITYHRGRMQENLKLGENIEDYYDVVTCPVFEGKEKIGAGVAGYAVSGDSKHRDYAWQFCKLILTHEGQNALADAGLTLPSIRKDMSERSAENHWTVGFDAYNLEAYTYRNGAVADEQPWDCYTSFFLKVHHMACNNIISSDLPLLVTNYLSGKSFETCVAQYTKDVENHIMIAELG